ncbi:glucosaminidase domain-containing protein [Alicyclobacillus sp. SP_1]|uniref:glucosaminidase domain-containing protein n=1 Tax=Alicyclobacillus sp. SP_1 TaxID=2942475 RepID=UPI0021576547|nr:glucosaminidase domain-containing protein [Alicyclobacillus sp. SP_1]
MKSRSFLQWFAAGALASLALSAFAPQTAYAATNPSPMTKRWIDVNGQAYEHPYAFVANGTTYMPLYYVMQALNHMGLTDKWNGQTWTMSGPSSLPANFADITLNQSTSNIVLDGTTIEHFPRMVAVDPFSGKQTTYIPIWYLQQALNRLQIFNPWDGQKWSLYSPSPLLALAAQPAGQASSAQGGADSTGDLFAAYASPTATPQQFGSEAAAANAISGNAEGYIVNLSTHQVVQLPEDAWSLNANGQFTSTELPGYPFSTPTFAQAGDVYEAVNAVAGSTPNDTQFYLISQDGTYSGAFAGVYEDPFRTVDLRFPAPAAIQASTLNAFVQTMKPNAGLSGLGDVIMTSAKEYGVSASYLLSHAILESGYGNNPIASIKNNLYGFGAYDANPQNDAGVFPSKAYAIRFQAWFVRNTYLDPSGSEYYESPTLDGMNQNYATDPLWAIQIAGIMRELSDFAGTHADQYTQYEDTNVPPTPVTTAEPVFLMTGAVGAIESDAPSGGLPIYPSVADGESVNGTGIMDSTALLSPGTSVQVNEMMQGFANGFVVEWYHVSTDTVSGWVDSQYVALSNVYRAVADGSPILPVYGSASLTSPTIYTIHTGNYVVSAAPTNIVNGMVSVQLVNQENGAPLTGYLPISEVSLVPVAPQGGNS